MGLILPEHLSQSRAAATKDTRVGVYYRFSDLTGRPVVVADIVQILARYQRSEVIKVLVLLMIIIRSDNGLELNTQLSIADRMLEPELREALDKHLRKPGVFSGRMFLPRQVYLVLQLALLACVEGSPNPEEQELRCDLGKCCLMANDILHEIEPKDPAGEGSEEFNNWLAAALIPILDRRAGYEVIARARAFWFEIPKYDDVQKDLRKTNCKSFDEAFLARYGISLREYFQMLSSIYCFYLKAGESSAALLDEKTYLTPMFAADDIERVMKTISKTPDRLSLQLLGTPRQNWATDVTFMQKHPLIEVFAERHACLDQRILLRCLTEKIYFLLQDAYPDNQFSEMFGVIFERYILGLLREFTYEGEVLERTMYANPHFQGSNDEAGDAVLVMDGTVVVMELKSKLLTPHEKYAGQRTKTLKGVNEILVGASSKSKKAVAQLAGNLPRILNGQAIVAGPGKPRDLSDCHSIIPAVVVLEENIAFEAVRQIAEKKFRDLLSKKPFESEKIRAILILGIGDIETIEALSRKFRPIDLLRDYASYVVADSTHRLASFNDFLRERGIARDLNDNESLTKRNETRALEEVEAELRARMPVV